MSWWLFILVMGCLLAFYLIYFYYFMRWLWKGRRRVSGQRKRKEYIGHVLMVGLILSLICYMERSLNYIMELKPGEICCIGPWTFIPLDIHVHQSLNSEELFFPILILDSWSFHINMNMNLEDGIHLYQVNEILYPEKVYYLENGQWKTYGSYLLSSNWGDLTLLLDQPANDLYESWWVEFQIHFGFLLFWISLFLWILWSLFLFLL